MKTHIQDPTREEMIEAVQTLKSLGFDEFDMEAAIYWFAHDHHSGQWSNLYSALSTTPFNPSPLARDIKHEGEVAEMIYDHLVETFAR